MKPTVADSDVTTYDVVFNPADADNYESLEGLKVTVTVTKAPLTVTADDKTVSFNAEPPTYTATYLGFVNGEDESVLVGELDLSCAYAEGDTPLALTLKDCKLTFKGPVGELMRGGGRLNVKADDLEVKGVRGPFLRRWGERRETFECDDVEGLDGESVAGEGPFTTKPI